MKTDIILVAGILVFISSLISLRVGLSVAIIEILLGAIAGNLEFNQTTGCCIWHVLAEFF